MTPLETTKMGKESTSRGLEFRYSDSYDPIRDYENGKGINFKRTRVQIFRLV